MEFFKGKTDKDKDKDFDSANIKEVNHHTVSISQVALAFDLLTNKSGQTQTKLGYSFLKLSNFRQFFTLMHRQSSLRLKGISCYTKIFNAEYDWGWGRF